MSELNVGSIVVGSSLQCPSYATSSRPTNLPPGSIIYNTDEESVETWNGTEWLSVGGGSDPDGSSAEKAATSAESILSLVPTAADGIYWINLPSVGPTQVYCAMSSNHLGGGGWMLAWKCTRGTTFNYDSNYWTTANTFNETSQLNLGDADHKNHVFNYYVANSFGAVFPDLNNGGQSSVPYNGWTWVQSGQSSTCLSRFQAAESQISSNPRGESMYVGSGFSNQNGFQWYGFNYTGSAANKVRWGFGWNNEGTQGSNDVVSGIAPVRAGTSAGDNIYCCQGTTGVNRSIRAEIWVK